MMKERLFFLKQDKFCSNKGFSLVETLIFLVLLLVGVVSLISLVNSYISTLQSAKERLIANMLAQEGLEIVLAQRNENFKTLNDPVEDNNQDWLSGIPIGKELCIDILFNSSSDKRIYFSTSSGLYLHDPTGIPTVFSRYIIVTTTDTRYDQNTVKVISIVNYGKNKVELSMEITKWHPLSQ